MTDRRVYLIADSVRTRDLRPSAIDSEPQQLETSMAGDDYPARWANAVCAKLDRIGKLDPGWDGYDADKFSRTTLTFVGYLLGAIRAEAMPLGIPAISPMSSGAVMIEWRTRTHEVTIEVNAPNDVNVLVEDLVTGATTELHETSNFVNISNALEKSVQPVRVVA